MWENDNIPEGTDNCPECNSHLDRNGYGNNCGGYHESDCDTCFSGVCDWSC